MGQFIIILNCFLSNDVETHRIRNYMSKPWFLKMTMESEPTPLAGLISQVLRNTGV
jgi:hypothetical protein